jgi:hypothetical protein
VSRHFTNWLKAFTDFASIGEAPLKFYFWTGVSTVAGALRRRVWLDMGHFRWTPNFYIILVAPPGIVSKTTTIDIGRRLLVKVSGINLGPDALTWQSLVQSMGECTELVILRSGEKFEMSAITIYSGELGTMLDPKDRPMVDALVALWDARDRFEKTSKTRGDDILVNPWLNIIACTTPSWISEHMPEYMAGGGLMSRCIFLYSEQKDKFVAYPQLVMSPTFRDTQEKLILDLNEIASLSGPFHMSREAISWGEAWYREHWATNLPSDAHYAGYKARKQTHLHKLAMIMSASQRSDLEITLDDLVISEAMLLALEKDSMRVFSNVGLTQDSRGQSELMEVMRRVGEGNKREVYRHLQKHLSWVQFEKAIDGCVKAGDIQQIKMGNETFLQVRDAKSRPIVGSD